MIAFDILRGKSARGRPNWLPYACPTFDSHVSAVLENFEVSSSSSEDKHLAGPDEKEIKWRTLESLKSTLGF